MEHSIILFYSSLLSEEFRVVGRKHAPWISWHLFKKTTLNLEGTDENPKAEKVCNKYPFDRIVSFMLSTFGTEVAC